jgi:hypothetical protein
MAIRTTIKTIKSQVGTVTFPWEADRLYGEWMALGGVELSRGHILASGLGAKGSAG